MTKTGEGAGGHSVAALANAVADLKPRARGWLHAYAALISLITGTALVAVTAALKGGESALSTSIYAATVTLLFGCSALYHRLNWTPSKRAFMRRLDHSMILSTESGNQLS